MSQQWGLIGPAWVQADRGAMMELPEVSGHALRDAITLADAEFDMFAGAGTYTSLHECAAQP